MTTIKINLDDETVKRIERVADRLHVDRDEWIRRMIERAVAAESDPLLGLCGDEPEAMDQVAGGAMAARERDPLRARRG